MPPWIVEKPGMLWPPPFTAISRPALRANRTAAMTSDAPAQRTTRSGRASWNMPFQPVRASS